MAKVIYTADANPLSLKVRFLVIETLASKVKSYLDTWLMYQSVPSTPLLRQLNYIIPYVDFNILHMNNFQDFSGLIWSLFTVGSCQKRAEAFFALPSNWLMISLRVIPVRVLVYRDIIFPLYLSSRLHFMDVWVFKWAFFEVLFPYNDKGENSSSKNQQQGLHVFKSSR